MRPRCNSAAPATARATRPREARLRAGSSSAAPAIAEAIRASLDRLIVAGWRSFELFAIDLSAATLTLLQHYRRRSVPAAADEHVAERPPQFAGIMTPGQRHTPPRGKERSRMRQPGGSGGRAAADA